MDFDGTPESEPLAEITPASRLKEDSEESKSHDFKSALDVADEAMLREAGTKAPLIKKPDRSKYLSKVLKDQGSFKADKRPPVTPGR